MSGNPRKPRSTKTKPKEYAVAVYAQDMEEAEEYQSMLRSNDIPAYIQQGGHSEERIPVLVPEDYADEADVIIEAEKTYDDFYDLAAEAEDEDIAEFDNDPYDKDM